MLPIGVGGSQSMQWHIQRLLHTTMRLSWSSTRMPAAISFQAHACVSFVQALSSCHQLKSANLTWCVKVTDAGVIAMACGCPSLGLLSLHGILGVTDAAILALQQNCADHMHTLDIQGCISIEHRSRQYLQQILPYLVCFEVHS